ncbi:MAG: fibronectin type III domain-containing protein [Methanomassiliicoccales archaeon]
MSNMRDAVLRTFVISLALSQILVVASLAIPTVEAGEQRVLPPTIYLKVAVQEDDILITWTPVPLDDEYGVYGLNITRMREMDWLNRTVLEELAPDATSFLDQNVTPGVTYYYRLMVLSDVDHSYYQYWSSTEIYIRTDAIAPSAPSELKVEAGGSQVNLTWKTSLYDGGATVYNYTVYVGSNSSDLEPLMNVRSNYNHINEGCTIGNLTNGQVYYFAVQAINPVGVSDLSNVVSAKPLPSPWLTVVSEETRFGHFEISVSWSPPETGGENLTGYVLYIFELDMLNLGLERGLDNRSYFHELNPFGEMLIYRVAAVYDDGNVSYSNTVELHFGMYEGYPFNTEGIVLASAIGLILAASIVIAWRVGRKK